LDLHLYFDPKQLFRKVQSYRAQTHVFRATQITATQVLKKNMSFMLFVVGMDAYQDSHYTGLWCALNYSMLQSMTDKIFKTTFDF